MDAPNFRQVLWQPSSALLFRLDLDVIIRVQVGSRQR
jgi:hypothetical protein